MAFMRLKATARNLNKYKKDLIKEKLASIEYRSTGKVKFKLGRIGIKIKTKLKKIKQRIGYCFCGKKFCFNLKHDGSIENYVLKSLLGFLGGLIITYVFFMIFVFQLNFKISTATIICSAFGCFLVNGLAFSTKIRCIVLLTLPHFFGDRGRQLLVAYALILVMSGPAQNILNNLGILSESLACGQEQLKSILRQIFEAIKKPFYAIKDAIKKVIATVKKVIKKIKEILIKIKRIIMSIIRVIKAAFMFLAKIINICNKELGTPFERCTRVFDNAIADCNAKLGPIFSWMCSITYIVKTVCYIVKIFDYVCMIIDFISNSIIGVVIRKIKGFIRHVRTMFYVRLRLSHSFHFETKASKTITEISKEIVDEIKDRMKFISAVFRFVFSAASLFFIFMIVKVVMYRYRFLTKDGFDNKYLTEDFFQLDIRRAKHNKETILPLNQREEKLYVKIKSSKLTDVESKKLRKAVMNLMSVCLKAAIYMAVDYALFWILNMIKYYGRFQSKVQAPNIPMPYISGKGLLADLLGSIVKAFQPMGLTLEIDTVPCLPTPIPPNYDKYIQIATLLILCWVLTLLEPYGLRFRSYIMSYYHPIRGKQRAIWLYNKILRKRSSFLKFARRQLRRKLFGSKDIERVTLKEFLSAHFRLFALCFDKSQMACLLCGKVFRENDTERPIKCATPGCAGIYCDLCFADLRNLCTVCLSPIEYGDLSDLSEEMDSSEDEKQRIIKKKKTKKRRQIIPSIYKNRSQEIVLDEAIPLIASRTSSKKSIKEKRSVNDIVDLSEKDDKEAEEDENVFGDDENEEEYLKTDENEESVDSGNVSTSSISSDYSYTYQYSKEVQKPNSVEISNKDLEKQEILDYASMDSFRDDYYAEFDEEKDNLKNMQKNEDFHKEFKNSENSLFRINNSSQIPVKTLSKQTSTEKILCPKYPMTSQQAKVDIGTILSGENIRKAKQDQRINFVGVDETDKENPRKKLKKRGKHKAKTVICACSDSNEDDGIQYWEKTSMVAVSKSTTYTNTRDNRKYESDRCKCKKLVCICKNPNFPAEEENTSDSQSYSSSSELRSLIEPKDKSVEKLDKEQDDLIENKAKDPKKSKLKMFIKRVIPKYKIWREKE